MNSIIAEADANRIDAFCAKALGISRNECVRFLEEGKILLNGKFANKKQSIKKGDKIEYDFEEDLKPLDIVPENIDLDIIYQDKDIAVINKPQGMVVHPAHGNYSGTLVHGIMYHIKDLSGINGVMRPGIVHRLDKNTSGLIIIAKNDKAHTGLAQQFKEHTNEKIYLALAEGKFSKDKFTVKNYIARSKSNRKKMAVYNNESEGKEAITEFEVIQQYQSFALVKCKLLTGRTHQIRVHLASISHPCLGDSEYGFKKQKYHLSGQALHSYKLTVDHPITGERMTFTAPIPRYFSDVIAKENKTVDRKILTDI